MYVNSVCLVVSVLNQCNTHIHTQAKTLDFHTGSHTRSQAASGTYELIVQSDRECDSENHLAEDLYLALQAVVSCCVPRLVYHLKCSRAMTPFRHAAGLAVFVCKCMPHLDSHGLARLPVLALLDNCKPCKQKSVLRRLA